MSKIPSDTQWADLASRIKAKANASDLPTKVSDLTNDSGYQTASDVSSAISSAVSSVMTYKGTVATVADLPASGNKLGDVYNVTATGGNYAWDGSSWDELGSTVDLSNYYTKSQTDTALAAKANASTTYTKTEVDTALSSKANASTTYTKTEVDTALAGKADVPAGGASYVTTADLATVATTGNYNDLSNKPTIPAAQIQSDWNQTTATAKDYIKNKPTILGHTGDGKVNQSNKNPYAYSIGTDTDGDSVYASVHYKGSDGVYLYQDEYDVAEDRHRWTQYKLAQSSDVPETFTTNEWNALWA